ncbi:MAG: 16S rRNA (guanine(966)-N(2))-methyltransferase RsmD [Candidatus Aminicenantes bacterium]|nr:16S rRNA (guanine(966)-N(2))-methyltransferase RsmD [Candidatus Aminicenantes bacterium]
MLRIIGGEKKGQRLKMINDPKIRPMPAKLREALFNIIQTKVIGATCLDGFAGSGAIGLEALSRGAAKVVFIEEYSPAIRIIRQNVEKCGFQDRTRIIQEEFNRGVIRLAKEKKSFDLIFIDPPYELLKERNPLKVIKKRGILKPNGLVILRHFNKIVPDLRFFERFRLVRYGDDVISFFRHRHEEKKELNQGREREAEGVDPEKMRQESKEIN